MLNPSPAYAHVSFLPDGKFLLTVTLEDGHIETREGYTCQDLRAWLKIHCVEVRNPCPLL